MESIKRDLKQMAKRDVLQFIRSIRVSNDLGSFEMSGYDGVTGDCTLHNMKILNAFAFLGIYDYTQFLFLDFYKGSPTIFYRYWREDETIANYGLTGLSTSELIYEIFEITIFSNKTNRPRIQ